MCEAWDVASTVRRGNYSSKKTRNREKTINIAKMSSLIAFHVVYQALRVFTAE